MTKSVMNFIRVGMLSVGLALATSGAVYSQATNQPGGAGGQTARDDRGFDWGWLGLVGLIGLAGLAKGHSDSRSATAR